MLSIASDSIGARAAHLWLLPKQLRTTASANPWQRQRITTLKRFRKGDSARFFSFTAKIRKKLFHR